MTEQIRARQRRLLDEIRATNREWTTGLAHGLYQATGWAPGRATAKKDLQVLARRGVLTESGPDNGRTYTLNHAKGGTA